MGLNNTFLKQFGKPTGNLGRFVCWLMSFKNKGRAIWTLEKLNLKSTDFVLEIVHGSGATFKNVAEKLTMGFIGGIDHSEIMLEQATETSNLHIHNRTKIAALKEKRMQRERIREMNF